MADKNLWGLIKSSPPWAKGVLVVVGTAAVTYAGYTIYKNAKKKKEIGEANKAAKDADKELVTLKTQGINPTLPDSVFEAMSQSLVQAMNGCGTNETTVYDQFRKLNNEADVRKLVSKFGVRFYEPCAASQPISYAKWLWNDESFGGGLPTWLSYDLSASEITKINDILKAKGINYTF